MTEPEPLAPPLPLPGPPSVKGAPPGAAESGSGSGSTGLVAVTVLGDDRPGIVADVTAALAAIDGNLEDSTMTLLRGHFAMVVLVRTTTSAAAIEDVLSPLRRDGSLVVDARVLAQEAVGVRCGSGYVLSVHGADRPGIVAAVTRVVADHGGNIVDLGTRLGGGLYVLTAELELPSDVEVAVLDRDLQGVAGRLGVDVHVTAVDTEFL